MAQALQLIATQSQAINARVIWALLLVLSLMVTGGPWFTSLYEGLVIESQQIKAVQVSAANVPAVPAVPVRTRRRPSVIAAFLFR